MIRFLGVFAASLSSVCWGQVFVGDDRVAERIREADHRLVDIIGIGDSNQVFDGSGWDHGWIVALSERYPRFATGLISPHENNGSGFSSSVRVATRAHGSLSTDGAPPLLDQLVDDILGNVHEYAYLDSGIGSDSQFYGISLAWPPGFPAREPVRFDFHYASTGAGEGSFRPAVRLGCPPWSLLATGNRVETGGPTGGLESASVTLSDGVGTRRVEAGFSVPNAGDIEGPFFGAYLRAVMPGIEHGFSYHTQSFLPGRSLREMAVRFQNASDLYLAEYYRLIRDEQLLRAPNDTPSAVFMINSGLNDRNETEPSVGPEEIADGDSAEAYSDNLVAIMDRVESAWALAGGNPEEEVWFLVIPSHALAEPDRPEEQELLLYRAAAEQLALVRPRVLSVNLPEIHTTAEYWMNIWFSQRSRAHLTPRGYSMITRDLLGLIDPEDGCPADLDGDGVANQRDLVFWFEAYRRGDPVADADNNGLLQACDFGAIVRRLSLGCDGPSLPTFSPVEQDPR